jgi:hypothetical protein
MSTLAWYNLELVHRAGDSNLIEKMNKEGRYGHRRDIEPIIRQYEKKFKEEKKLLKAIKSDIEGLRRHVIKTGGDMNGRFETMLSRLDEIIGKS